ncbi:MAG TPA: NUDIX domain-containing protein [Calditrichia bacterium]|nr:NUDIX domain-containing protein [Calditrichota bacterium]HQV31637.1 NUDIX domain-containing protein [Calditrichia bacterium]
MNNQALLKSLFWGFLPVIAYLIVESAWGIRPALVIAVLLGVLELFWIFWREGRLEKFVLGDILLVILLGAISLWLENPVFFKLKPALLEGFFAVFLVLGAFTRVPVAQWLMGRYLGEVGLSPVQEAAIRQNMRWMLGILVIHIFLTIYAAFYLSEAAWGFISGGLLLVLFGLMFVGQLAGVMWKRRQIRGEEWFDLVTPEGRITGKAPRRAVHGNPDLLHAVVHIQILNRAGHIFLQKRSRSKDTFPGYWDTAVGGHVLSGESVEIALKREALEELGISNFQPQPLARYVLRNQFESELVFSFLLKHEGPFRLQAEEIDEGRFWAPSEIEDQLGLAVFTPNFEEEYQLMKKVGAIKAKPL